VIEKRRYVAFFIARPMNQKNIIAYALGLPIGAAESIRKYGKAEGKRFRIMNIVDAKAKDKKPLKAYEDLDILLEVDFSKPHKIAEALLPYQDELLAITCRYARHPRNRSNGRATS
jgi:hypothetical protein